MLSQSSQYLLIIVVHIHNNDVLKDFCLIGHSSKEVSVIYLNLFINTKKYNMTLNNIIFNNICSKKYIYCFQQYTFGKSITVPSLMQIEIYIFLY